MFTLQKHDVQTNIYHCKYRLRILWNDAGVVSHIINDLDYSIIIIIASFEEYVTPEFHILLQIFFIR